MALSMDESWLFVPSKNDKNCTIIDIYSSLIRTNIYALKENRLRKLL